MLSQISIFLTKLNFSQRFIVISFSSFFIFLLAFLYLYSNVENNKLSYPIVDKLDNYDKDNYSLILEQNNIPFQIIKDNGFSLYTSKEFSNISKILIITNTRNIKENIHLTKYLKGKSSLPSIFTYSPYIEKISLMNNTVKLKIKNGFFFSSSQLKMLKKILANSLSIKVENLTIKDLNGNDLFDSSSFGNDSVDFSQNQLKLNLEKNLKEKVSALVSPIVGKEHFFVNISTVLDFKEIEYKEEIYDPEGTIRSEQLNESNSFSNTLKDEKSNSIINYEISNKKVFNKDENSFKIVKIFVAVTLKTLLVGNDKQEFLLKLEELVSDSVGVDKQRGDRISIKGFGTFNKPIKKPSVNVMNESFEENLYEIKSSIIDFSFFFKLIAVIIIASVFYFKFVKPNNIIFEEGIEEDKDISNNNLKNEIDNNETSKETYKNNIRSNINSAPLNEDNIKHDILKDNIDKEIIDNPKEVAQMIELLLKGK